MSSLYCAGDSALAHSARQAAESRHPSWVLPTTILASGLAFVDGSVVNVALPTIGQSLNAEAAALQWIVNSYLLPLSALLLLGGAAGDYFGRRRLLIAGTAVFALGSLGCTLSPSLPSLLAARLVQGIGAAMLLPNSLAILGQTFSGDSKGRAIGIWAASGAAMGAIGPVIGGWLIDLGSWRAIFLLNLPAACAAIFLAWRFVPQDSRGNASPLDTSGGILATAGLGVLTWALTEGSGSHGWTRIALIAAGIAVLLLVFFLRIEAQRGAKAMMPLTLFGSKSFVGLTIYTLFLYAALSILFVLLPYVLIKGAAYSGVAAGAALLPLPLILTVSSPAAGALASRIGARLPLAIGPLVVAAGFMLALRIDSNANYWTSVLPMVLVIALGMSAAVAPLTTAVLTSVDAAHTGSASGFNSAVARIGGLVATALIGSVLAAEGHQLLAEFRMAMAISAATCVAAAVSAFLLLARDTHS